MAQIEHAATRMTNGVRRMRKLLRNILMLGVLGLWSVSAFAQGSGGKDREIVLTPYLWGTSINGTSTIGVLPPLDVDASFGDILSNLNFAMSLHTEFRFDDWVFVIDPTYISLEMGGELPEPVPPGTTLSMEVEIWLVELWAGYSLNEEWEAIGGLRYQDQDISIVGLPDPPSPVSSVGVADNWTDWFIGARFTTDINDKWFIVWRGDVVVAGDSDSSWNSSIFFNRRFGENKALNVGYRYLVDDYANVGVYGWDVTQSGPVVGFTWVF